MIELRGATTSLTVKLASRHLKQRFQVLPSLDGMDTVLGMDVLAAHDIVVVPRRNSIVVPS